MDGWVRGLRRAGPVAAHAAAVLLVVAAVVEALLTPVGVLEIVAVLGMTVPVLWCRRAPLVAVVVSYGALALSEGFGGDVTSEGYAPVLALVAISYAAGRWTTGRAALLAGGFLLALTWTSVLLGPDPDLPSMLLSLLITALPALGPWLAGRAIRGRDERVGQLLQLNEELERKREEGLQMSLELDRAHLARELHDVLAHSITVMVVQAEAAEEMMLRDPEQARRAVRQVQDSGRTALTETRQVLTDLRDAQLYRVAQVQELVEAARAGGLDVELRTQGEPRAMAVAAETAAFRIVQEALTNVRKHSDARSVVVTLAWSSDGLDIDVTDDGTSSAPTDDRAGLGLRGMGERVALHGGELRAGVRSGRGFAVTARLPVVQGVP
jgi:signal transduction histidine kinase